MTRFPLLILALGLCAGQAAAGLSESPRPAPRPELRLAAPVARAALLPAAVVPALGRSPRPEPRPEVTYRMAAATAGMRSQPGTILKGRKGALCGDPRIQGETLAPIPGRIKGCGLADPVRVTAVDGVPLSRPATMDCATAKALRAWVAEGVKPAVGRKGGGVASIKVVADYACRTRNNQPGARISEHGRGRALDISAINLRNGTSLSVLKGWRDPAQAKALRQMHKAACGPFGTVLGPDANRYHQDHFHFDTARYRSGPYCR